MTKYGEGNDKSLTGKHETFGINTFKLKLPIAMLPSASLARLRQAAKYMEDRRPAANGDPYSAWDRPPPMAFPVLSGQSSWEVQSPGHGSASSRSALS